MLLTASFVRPADANIYAIGDLVANSVTAGLVVPMVLMNTDHPSNWKATLRRARIKKSTNVLTNASFRLHLFSAPPVVTNGDNGVFLCTQNANYLGSFDVAITQAFADGSTGIGTPTTGSEVNASLVAHQKVYGLLEARGTYTPGNAEVFTCEVEVIE